MKENDKPDCCQMTKWEYTIASCKGDFDSFGQNGWELVSVSDGTAYFKRLVIGGNLITTGKRLEKLNADMIDSTQQIRG